MYFAYLLVAVARSAIQMIQSYCNEPRFSQSCNEIAAFRFSAILKLHVRRLISQSKAYLSLVRLECPESRALYSHTDCFLPHIRGDQIPRQCCCRRSLHSPRCSQ